MKAHSPLFILALWLIALTISSMVLHSCEKPELPMRGGCMMEQADTTSNTPDTTQVDN